MLIPVLGTTAKSDLGPFRELELEHDAPLVVQILAVQAGFALPNAAGRKIAK
jgi:hypothetical protein